MMADRRASNGSDLPRKTVPTKQKDKDKSTKKAAKSLNASPLVHCVCSSQEDIGNMVECESCNKWSHCKCVSLPPSLAASYPFVCPFCIKSLFSRLSTLESEVTSLSNRISSLESSTKDDLQSMSNDVQRVRDSLNQISQTPVSIPALPPVNGDDASGNQMQLSVNNNDSVSVTRTTPHRNQGSHILSRDRTCNLVVSGLPECPRGTNRTNRAIQDQNSILTVLSPLCSTLSTHSIRDIFRLGKYVEGQSRPILVKLQRPLDVSIILSNKRLLAETPNVSVRPDLSPHDKAIYSTLMRERRALILSGHESRAIKIKKNCLFLDGCLYGKVIDSSFVLESSDTPSTEIPPSDIPGVVPSLPQSLPVQSPGHSSASGSFQ
uniref:PHD-type domain-containing protein n=1 Tax=Amphimedon queenslandica TaxID=400682 RepID=A0A1X7UGB3_AMPQE